MTPLQFAALMPILDMRLKHEIAAGLREAGAIVRDEAQRVLGTYEYGWPQLSPVTIERKAGQANTPGIETREMHDSIGFAADTSSVQIGSDLEKAVWFELGRPGQPPRSFLAGALVHKTEAVVTAIGERVNGVFSVQRVTFNDEAP